MKLAECLSVADIAVLRRIATHYDFPCSRHSKMALIQEIQYQFRDPAFLQQRVPQWTQFTHQSFLRLALDPRRSFSVEDITALFHCDPTDDPIQSAESEGWLYRLTMQYGRTAYIIPVEVQAAMKEAVVQQFSSGVSMDPDGPLVFQDESFAMGRDLEVVLDYVRHHEVKLTTEGSMYKRNLQQLLELLEVTEDIPTESWRFGYGRRFHDYPDRLALLYDFAYYKGFLEEGTHGWLRATETAEEWVLTGPVERARQMMKFYINLYRRPIPRLPFIIQLMAAISPDWISSEGMLGVLNDLVSDYYYDNRVQVWTVRMLKMMTHLGVIRYGEDNEGGAWFQITQLGQQLITPDSVTQAFAEPSETERVLIVQPNFDIIVTADQPVITNELACFTDLYQAGMVRVYQLSERSMMRGLSLGKSGTAWLDFLNRHAQTAVPGNVERTIEDWNRKHGAVPPLADAE